MNKVTLLEFFADWCSACKAQDSILEELERDIGHKVDIIKIGLTENKDIFDEYEINATPTMFLVRNNNILKKYVGVTSKDELESAINIAYRPETTLFMLMSVDGKISTGDTDVLDVDNDLSKIIGIKEGLQQYYNLEKQTDLFSLNTGRVFAKIGINEKADEPKKLPVSFVVIDNKPHLIKQGVLYLAKKVKNLIIVTTNKSHPAKLLKKEFNNIHVLEYENAIDFTDLFVKLKQEFGADKLTVQSGGTLNATLIREGLIDRIMLVVFPALVGGKNTSTVMDGESLHTSEELNKIKTLEFVQAKPLENSYLLLEYRVKN
jgi:2,5-diamino-6-(ribosylamino)-4(3H)-pyrimidinone 5'-phosphate reductase